MAALTGFASCMTVTCPACLSELPVAYWALPAGTRGPALRFDVAFDHAVVTDHIEAQHPEVA